jgi:hypothetical protein
MNAQDHDHGCGLRKVVDHLIADPDLHSASSKVDETDSTASILRTLILLSGTHRRPSSNAMAVLVFLPLH